MSSALRLYLLASIAGNAYGFSKAASFAAKASNRNSDTALSICFDPFCDCDGNILGPNRRQMLKKSGQFSSIMIGQAGLDLVGISAQPAVADVAAVEKAQKKVFPTALSNANMESTLYTALNSKDIGFNQRNTLLATSFCPDELNLGFVDMLTKRYGQTYNLAGLGGLPFTGTGGLGSFLSHVPDRIDGKALIMFAPHVGINDDGTVGKIRRPGQKTDTTACGAAIGAYKYLSTKDKLEAERKRIEDREITDIYDGQEEYIINELETRLKGIDQASDPQAYVAYQMYDMTKELLFAELEVLGDDVWKYTKDIAIVGGIMINRSKAAGGDYFQPLMFEMHKQGGRVIDMYEETFGIRPNLTPILGTSVALGDEYALSAYFPGALPMKTWDAKMFKVIGSSRFGFNARNTLLASSIDPDELNGPFANLITRRYGEVFPLGGIAGVPFAGKSGLDAFLHHVPNAEDGKVVIVFAPNVGISDDGSVGKIQREDQVNKNSACGAVVNAMKVINADKANRPPGYYKKNTYTVLDQQEEYILAELEERLAGIEKSADPVAFATYQVYDLIKEYLFIIFNKLGDGVWKETTEIIFAGGIIINRSKRTGDFFMPLMLESHREDRIIDIYEEAFGPKPDTSTILDARPRSYEVR